MDELDRAARALGGGIAVEGTVRSGLSGSGVYRVRVDGADAVLKVTSGADRRAARRELSFYRTLAGRVPVRTPGLLGHADDEELTAVLLTAHDPGPPAAAWDRADWLAAARQLGALHAIAPPTDDVWQLGPGWLDRCLAGPPAAEVGDYWRQAGAGVAADRLLADRAALARGLAAVPACFTHGDCHADNLLRDGDELVWADWQGAGIGSPAGDLAFLWNRGNADRADLPYDAMLAEYLAANPAVEAAAMGRALTAIELGVSLYGWPEYARFHAAGERDRMTRRLLDLERAWRGVR